MKRNAIIAIGGIFGAIARYEVKTASFFGEGWQFPIQTFLTNLLGCFLIAIVLTAAFEYLIMSTNLRLGIATGFLGAFTTFSTMCKEIYFLITLNQCKLSILYGMASLFFGYIAVYLGVILTRFLMERLFNKESHCILKERDRS